MQKVEVKVLVDKKTKAKRRKVKAEVEKKWKLTMKVSGINEDVLLNLNLILNLSDYMSLIEIKNYRRPMRVEKNV